jgi:2-methylcitrate dehydratase PrpD
VLDFDDLHMASTTHISAVCVPVALAAKGGARAYLAGAGVMARLGTALGWRHYTAGWHATCTAGAPAAAVTAAVARNLDPEQIAIAIALAVPAAGGVQRAFGTAAKALQVGFAADAGVRAAGLAAAGATADPRALDDWIALANGEPAALASIAEPAPAVPGGLAIKLFPCCYALQRPISAMRTLAPLPPDRIESITVTTPASSVTPLIHSSPTTGLEGKFSLEYGIAAAILDGDPGLASFTDAAVDRPEAQRLVDRVRVVTTAGGEGLLDGEVTIELTLHGGETRSTSLALPAGAPQNPPTDEQLKAKIGADLLELGWDDAAGRLDRSL